MPDIKEDLLSPIKRAPSKPYRGHPNITVRDIKDMGHAELMALDREIDQAHRLQHQVRPGDGLGQGYAVGYKPGQSGIR